MKRRTGLGMALLLALVVPHANAQSGHDLFQRALVSERNDAELQRSIALYRRIADEYAADRQLAARALLRLGAIYETLGSAEATKIYARLVRDLTEQDAEVAEARARLAALTPGAALQQHGLPTRRPILDLILGGWVPSHGAPIGAKPAPDGRHLIRYDWERRAFVLAPIESAGPTHLAGQSPDTTRSWQPNHAFLDKLSPDGRLIASVVRVRVTGDSAPARDQTWRKELRVFEVGGRGEGRMAYAWHDPDVYYRLSVFGWSPDQSRVWLWGRRLDRSAEIAWVDIGNGSFQVLKTLRWSSQTQDPSLSPDGKFIAFPDADTRDGPPDVFLLATDGSREVRVEHPASDSKPIFAPDGSGIVFDSDRRGIRDLWFLPVVDGRPAGEPRLVFEDIFPFNAALEFGDNGSLFYAVALQGWETYTAEIDLAAGTVGVPERIEPRGGEMNTTPAFSPDGRFLAHLRSGRRLVLRELSTGAEREFPIPPVSMILASIDWCPGGSAVIVTSFQRDFLTVRVDLEHGGAERLPLADPLGAVCVGDGNDIVYLRPQSSTDPTRMVHVVRHSLATGAESVLATGPFGILSRSPDGKRIVFARRSEIESRQQAELLVMPSTGGDAVSVATFPLFEGLSGTPASNLHGFMWLPDGNALLIALGPDPNLGETSPEITLHLVPLDSGTVRVVGRMRLPAFARSFYGSGHYTLHPDASRIAFGRHAGSVEQIWAIDNLLQFIQSGESLPIAAPPYGVRRP